jgi:hypothetical protein
VLFELLGELFDVLRHGLMLSVVGLGGVAFGNGV